MRLDRRTLTEREQDRLVDAAIVNLGDDGAAWNAQWALYLLRSSGEAAIPALEQALGSRDRQRRQLAAHILRERWHDGRARYGRPPLLSPYAPTDDLFRVTVEGLADDDLADLRGMSVRICNATDGLVFLAENGTRSAPYLEPGLGSHDLQQRFLSAVAAAFCGCGYLVDRAAPVLLEHLSSTSTAIGGDAAAAARALYLFGPPVLPYVRPLIASTDRQQADLARLITMDLETPNRPIGERRALNAVAGQVHDPATDLSIGALRGMLH